MKCTARKARKLLIIVLLILAVILVLKELAFAILSRPFDGTSCNIYDHQYYISHAGGQIDSLTYLNCEEGLRQSIERGYKYIEFDLCLTEDSQLVFTHDKETFMRMAGGGKNLRFNYETFKKSLLYNKYHALAVEDILPFLKNGYFCLVTDRISSPSIIDSYFSSVKENVMIEATTIDDFNELKKLGYRPMLTLGDLNHYEFWYYIRLAIKNKYPIDWIVISATQSDFRYVRILKRLYGVKTAMYTENDKSFFEEHVGKEADLVYTDTWIYN